MKKELQDNKRKEVEKYLNILKQEDNKYDFESQNMQQIENQLVGLYKKKKH